MPPCIPLINTLRQNLAISLADHFVDSDNLFSFSVYEYSEDKIAAGLSCDVQSNPAISKEDRIPLDLPFPFTLPRLFRNPAISNFFSISLGTSK